MILDEQLKAGASQDISGAATTVATDTWDFGANIRLDAFKVAVNVVAKAGTTPDLKIEVFGDTAAGFGSEKSLGARSIVTADLVAGKTYFLDVSVSKPYRYYRVKYTQAGNADNSATVVTHLISEAFTQKDILLAGVSTP